MKTFGLLALFSGVLSFTGTAATLSEIFIANKGVSVGVSPDYKFSCRIEINPETKNYYSGFTKIGSHSTGGNQNWDGADAPFTYIGNDYLEYFYIGHAEGQGPNYILHLKMLIDPSSLKFKSLYRYSFFEMSNEVEEFTCEF